jgi:hypothetical protein
MSDQDLTPGLGGQPSDHSGREPALGGDRRQRRNQVEVVITVDTSQMRDRLARMQQQMAEGARSMIEVLAETMPALVALTPSMQAMLERYQAIELLIARDVALVSSATGCTANEARVALIETAQSVPWAYEDASPRIRTLTIERLLAGRDLEMDDVSEAEE